MKDKKILICDDERGIRESLKLILSDIYEIISAENSAQAIEKLDKNPDTKAVLLDIKMPGINGMQTLRQIRDKNNNVPVVIITGYQSVETASKLLNTGAAYYVTKPFEADTIIDTVKKAVSQL